MSRVLRAVVWTHLVVVAPVAAQHSPGWRVLGDTSGTPPGCSAAAAIAAIDAWFVAFNRADFAALARVTAAVYDGPFVFSTGKFTPADTFVIARTFPELRAYLQKRAARHERVTIQEVTFNRWRGRGGRGLEFGPIYLVRTADDLGQLAHPGIGKGEYWCNAGISVLNTAPRPRSDRGPRPQFSTMSRNGR